jgi:hypothetical protein
MENEWCGSNSRVLKLTVHGGRMNEMQMQVVERAEIVKEVS